MNRRSFMKAAGAGLCLAALPLAESPAKMSIQELIKARGNDSCDTSLIKEHCEGSFIPGYNPYNRRYATQTEMSFDEYIALHEQSQTLNNSRFTMLYADKRSGFTADAGYLMFNPLRAELVGKDRYRVTLVVDFRERGFNLTAWYGSPDSGEGKTVEIEPYKRIDFADILSDDLVWTEIKENI